MNWKRGLTRLYLALWLLFAGAGGWFIGAEIVRNFNNAATLQQFLEAHPEMSYQSLRDYEPRSLWERLLSPESLADTSRDASELRWLEEAADAATDSAEKPVRYALRFAGAWLLLFGLAPAVLLLALRWIIAGFAQST